MAFPGTHTGYESLLLSVYVVSAVTNNLIHGLSVCPDCPVSCRYGVANFPKKDGVLEFSWGFYIEKSSSIFSFFMCL